MPPQCIRFGHTVPVTAHVDAQIVQDEDTNISHTWTNYKFGDFSNVRSVLTPPPPHQLVSCGKWWCAELSLSINIY